MKKEITYTEKGGYLYPDLELPEQEEVFVGIWGQRHRRYLKTTNKSRYFSRLISGELAGYLAEVDRQAQEMFETIVNDTKEIRGITEQMKADDPMKWVQEMNNISNVAREFVMREMVCGKI